MSSKKSRQGTDSPSSSSSHLPLRKSTRRGSATSQSTLSLTDRESLTQALDQIHSTASRSSTLTTFDEFTTPPSSSSAAEGKGIASELHGGLSGLYSRIRASVGGVRDIVGGISLAGEDVATGDGDGDDEADNRKALPTPVPTPTTSIWAPTVKPLFHSPKYANSTSKADVESPTNLLSPLSNAITTGPSNEVGQVSPHTRPGLANFPTAIKGALPLAGAVKAPFVPLTQAISSTAVGPALIPVNVTAVNEKGSQNLENIDHGNNTPRISSNLARTTFAEDYRIEKQHKHQNSTSSDQGRGNTDAGTNHGVGPHGQQEVKAFPEPASATKNPLYRPSTFPDRNSQAKEPLEKGYDSSQADMQGPATPSRQSSSIPVTQLSRPPYFKISRASSSETTGAYSSNIPLETTSSHDEASENDSVFAENETAKKAATITQASGNPQTVNAVLSQIRSRVLSKEYWMRDENARDCFFCGDAFSTFRRKHHCSMCKL